MGSGEGRYTMIGVTCTISFGKGTKKTTSLSAKRSGPDPTREYTPLVYIRGKNNAQKKRRSNEQGRRDILRHQSDGLISLASIVRYLP